MGSKSELRQVKKKIQAKVNVEKKKKERAIKRQKEEGQIKRIILGLIKQTIENKITWTEVVNTMSAGIIRKKYTTNIERATIDFNVISYKNSSREDRNNILLTKEKNGKILFQYNLLNTDEDIKNLYTQIQSSANSLKEKKYAEKKAGIGHQKKEIQIRHGDFIIRTNLLQCSEKHILEEIIGLLMIITPAAQELVEKVPCAFCEKCNCFYMLDSEYKRVSAKGVLLCQIITYEEYSKIGGKLNTFNWSNESILMRNGYNVKANKNLTDEQRQIILRNIMDNKILTAHGIVSYIDMFVAQKRGLPQYQNAVRKWEKDKQFVLNYKNPEKAEVEIQSIRKTNRNYY